LITRENPQIFKANLTQKLPKFGCPFASLTVNLLDANRTFLGMRDGDLAVTVGELPGCEGKKGRIVQVRGPVHLSEQCGELLLWSLSNDLGSCLAEHLS
jgi:hypothetical protein